MTMVELKPGEKVVRERTFHLFWLGSNKEPETVKGYDIADAFSKAGYGGGAIRALDYYKDVTDEQ